ncbi:MAG: ATP-binding cassette domain-containing protein, partial [Candidatus Acidiferrum sp.]
TVKIAGVIAKTRGSSLPRRRIAAGLGFLSEDRQREGLALDQSITDNLTYSRLRPFVRCGWLKHGERRRRASDWLARLAVRCTGPDQQVLALSGGNQQKVAIGRLLHQDADVLLLDEPTRGVDVGSKVEIYRLIGALAARGKAVLFVSSYLPELLGVCDRVAVMARGKIAADRAAADWTPREVMAYAVGR